MSTTCGCKYKEILNSKIRVCGKTHKMGPVQFASTSKTENMLKL